MFTKEEIYGENAVNDPLDIIFDLEEEYGAQELLQPLGGLHALFSKKGKHLEVLTKPGFFDWLGDHRPYGILFACGSNIKNTSVDGSIVDIVPTVLAAMNLSIPQSIDGSVLTDLFIHPPKISRTKSYPEKKTLLSMTELQKIRKLKKLSTKLNKN